MMPSSSRTSGGLASKTITLESGFALMAARSCNVDDFETRIALSFRKQFGDAKGMGRCAQPQARNQNRCDNATFFID